MKIPVRPGEPPKDAVLMNVERSDERWNTYELDDGSIIKFRAVVAEIWRVEGEYDAQGNPVYVVKAQNITDVTAPESVKRK
jgi:hypothetical protein